MLCHFIAPWSWNIQKNQLDFVKLCCSIDLHVRAAIHYLQCLLLRILADAPLITNLKRCISTEHKAQSAYPGL